MKKWIVGLIVATALLASVGCFNPAQEKKDYYKLACENGYTGTEAEFAETIATLGMKDADGIANVWREGDVLNISLKNGHVFKIDISVQGVTDGKDGKTPYIGENGNWWIDGEDTGVVAENRTMHTVAFNDDYFKYDTEITVKHGECVDLPIPEREGYIFAGWHTGIGPNDRQFSSYDPVYSDLKLYAKWQVIDDYYYTDGLIFKYNNGGAYTVRYDVPHGSNARFDIEEIYIPSYYNDGIHGVLPVTSITMEAFMQCKSLKEIHIPETVTFIGQFAFRYCESLERIVLPDALEWLWGDSFWECNSLKEIVVSENSVNYETIDGILYRKSGTLVRCPSALEISEVVVPQVNFISGYAFSGNPHIEKVVFSNGLKEIRRAAFRDCVNLKSVDIPDTVTRIEENVFFNCEALQSIELPSGLITLGENAFYRCYALKEIDLPSNITELSEGLFLNCKALTRIGNLEQVTKIGEYALSGCRSLEMERLELLLVAEVGRHAFVHTNGIKSIVFSENVILQGEGVFWYWTEEQTIYFKGEEENSSAWDEEWNKGCEATFVWGSN